MATLSHKPDYLDFNDFTETKTFKFVHSFYSIEIADIPEWIRIVEFEYEPYSGGDFFATGFITVKPVSTLPQVRLSSVITLLCDSTDTYVLPVVYAYDSTSIPVSKVVDGVIMSLGGISSVTHDDIITATLHAQRWIQDNVGVGGTNVRMEEVPVENGRAPVPGDFVSPLGVYDVSKDGFLKPLYYNDDINISEGQLQDENGMYITDENGIVIGVYGLTPRVRNDKALTYYGVDLKQLMSGGHKYIITPGRASTNGMCRYNPSAREFIITGGGIETVVVEYVCDPILRNKLNIDHGELKVHKNYREALEKYIYYSLIEQNNAIPYNEKARALREYRLAMQRSERRNMNLVELVQILRG